MENTFESEYCRAKIQRVKNDVTVTGTINDHVIDHKIRYIAAAPPDFKASFTASGLPFQGQEQAFDNTPNSGEIILNNMNEFKIDLMMPNSYGVGLGSVIVPPTLYIMYQNKTITIKLSKGIPYRHITYPMQRAGPEFYDTQFNLFPKSQWVQCVESSYPKINKQWDDYWGPKPPL
jgi:hypothetical protein